MKFRACTRLVPPGHYAKAVYGGNEFIYANEFFWADQGVTPDVCIDANIPTPGPMTDAGTSLRQEMDNIFRTHLIDQIPPMDKKAFVNVMLDKVKAAEKKRAIRDAGVLELF